MSSYRRLCALLLFSTSAIHVAVMPAHYQEWKLAAYFFAVLAVVEAIVAVKLLRSEQRSLFLTGAVVSVATATLWAVSRTFGLPVGPHPFTPEAIGVLDATSTVFEKATAAVLVHLATRNERVPVASVTPTLASHDL